MIRKIQKVYLEIAKIYKIKIIKFSLIENIKCKYDLFIC